MRTGRDRLTVASTVAQVAGLTYDKPHCYNRVSGYCDARGQGTCSKKPRTMPGLFSL